MAKSPAQPAPASRSASAPAGVLARLRGVRAWLWRHKLAAGIVGAAVALCIGGAVGTTLLFRTGNAKNASQLLTEVLARLDAGDDRQARQIAAQLRAEKELSFIELGGPMYVLGVVTAREAQEHFNPTDQRMLYLVASRYLEEARHRGFPAGREQDGLALLGRSLHHSGRYAQSLPYLNEAMAAQPNGGGQLPWLLADSYLHLTPPKLDEALRYTRQYLAAPELSPREIDSGHLLESQILLAQGSLADAEEALAKITETSPVYAEAVVMQSPADGREGRESSSRRSPNANVARRNDCRAARRAGARRLGWWRRRAGAASHRPVLRAIGRPAGGHRPVRPRPAGVLWPARGAGGDRVSSRPGPPGGECRRSGRPVSAGLVASRSARRLSKPLAFARRSAKPAAIGRRRPDRQTRVRVGRRTGPQPAAALARRVCGPAASGPARSVGQKAAGRCRPATAREAEVTLAEARQHLREAGAAAQRLAELRVATRYYPDDLATAGRLFSQGQGYRQAAQAYRALLKQDPQQGQPEALVGLGEALLALGEIDAARAALSRCRENFSKHPATYRARLLESTALAGARATRPGQGTAARQSVPKRPHPAKQRLARFAVCPGPLALPRGQRPRNQKPPGRRRSGRCRGQARRAEAAGAKPRRAARGGSHPGRGDRAVSGSRASDSGPLPDRRIVSPQRQVAAQEVGRGDHRNQPAGAEPADSARAARRRSTNTAA